MVGTGISRQIIGSFEDIGKNIGQEVVKAPMDIAGSALESLGVKSGKAGNANPLGSGDKGVELVGTGGSAKSNSPLSKLDATSDVKIKQAIARSALAQLAGKPEGQKEPTVWERLQQEEAQKKEYAKQRSAASAMSALPVMSSKPKRGNMYGTKAKKSPTEIGKNVRQD